MKEIVIENLKKYIESGILEAYIMGVTSKTESLEVETYAATYSEVRNAIERISIEIEAYHLANAVTPDPIIKPMVMATIDFIQRMENGESPSFPLLLNKDSSVNDYTEWLQREDMTVKPGADDVYAKIISYTPQVTTAIVWLKDMAPQEVHHDEYERFLIVEGSCDIMIGQQVHTLQPGDFLEIPLHTTHAIKVTSPVTCKVILQRVAA